MALSLQVGFVTSFLLIVVVLPIAAVIWRSTGNGWSGFWEVVSSPQAVSALKLTMIMSTLAVLTTAVFGTIIAWVLVRDSFAGKSVVNAIIDLPFALPTIVAGITLLALYGESGPFGVNLGAPLKDCQKKRSVGQTAAWPGSVPPRASFLGGRSFQAR